MTISWVNSEGKTGIAENEYEFAMQHQMVEAQTIGDVVPRREASPQERINESFSQIPPKRYDDQNNPAVWGLGEVNQNIDSMMEDPGPKQRQKNIQQELDSGQQRTPVEREASLEQQLGDPAQIPTSAYQQFADYVHDLRVKFTGEPDKWSGKEVVGDFLDKAMSVMGAGYRMPKIPIRTGIPERITSPAIKSGNKVFEGENHGIAYEKADSPESYVDGYVTNKGRFVTREEAAGIAKGQEQVLMEARQTEELHSGELKPGYERTPNAVTRLYRAETSTLPGEKPAPVADWVTESPEYKSMLEATGRWFTNSRESAQWYMDKMGGKRISFIDVPSKDLEGYNVANNPEARKFTAEGRANEEFFLPSEIAATRKSLAAQEAFDAKVAAGKKIGAADYPHVQEAFLKEIEAGNIKVSDLAEKLKLSDDQVRAVAKATNTDLNSLRYSTWNEKNTQQLKDMIAEGKTYTEIAEELGVTRSAVGGKVDRLGLELRHDLSTTGTDKRAHPNLGKIYDDELRTKIRTMFAKGKTSKEIAEEMGLNPSTLRYQTSIHQLRK